MCNTLLFLNYKPNSDPTFLRWSWISCLVFSLTTSFHASQHEPEFEHNQTDHYVKAAHQPYFDFSDCFTLNKTKLREIK